jgi:hypothetical protein
MIAKCKIIMSTMRSWGRTKVRVISLSGKATLTTTTGTLEVAITRYASACSPLFLIDSTCDTNCGLKR